MNILKDYPEFRDHPLSDEVAKSIDERLSSYINSNLLRELVTSVANERDVAIPTVYLNDEDSFMQTAQLALDFRNGKAREDILVTELSQPTTELLHELIDQFGMKRETEPSRPDFALAIVAGAAGKVPANRLAYMRDLEQKGRLLTPVITLIGSERPVNMKQNALGETELDRAGLAGYSSEGVPAKTEFDIMRNTAAVSYGLKDADWSYLQGQDPEVPSGEGFQDSYRIAYAKAGEQDIFVVSAPMLDEDRISPNGNPRTRANTTDGYLFLMKLINPKKDDTLRALVVTDAVFTPFQHVDAEKVLAPIGVEVETVGFTREYAGMAGDWPGGDAYYLQELLSTFRSTRAARDRLTRSI